MNNKKKPTKEAKDFIGKKAYMPTPQGVYVEVIIVDYIPSFGRDRFLVKPKSGTKTAKVENILFTKPTHA